MIVSNFGPYELSVISVVLPTESYDFLCINKLKEMNI
jgi:hypothetical protein